MKKRSVKEAIQNYALFVSKKMSKEDRNVYHDYMIGEIRLKDAAPTDERLRYYTKSF